MTAGIEGLQRACDKWDFKHNLKFSTYATNWVISKMQRAIAEQARPAESCLAGAAMRCTVPRCVALRCFLMH